MVDEILPHARAGESSGSPSASESASASESESDEESDGSESDSARPPFYALKFYFARFQRVGGNLAANFNIASKSCVK